jgi:hypothetical protein
VFFPSYLSNKTAGWLQRQMQHMYDQVAFDGMWLDMSEAANFCSGMVCELPLANKSAMAALELPTPADYNVTGACAAAFAQHHACASAAAWQLNARGWQRPPHQHLRKHADPHRAAPARPHTPKRSHPEAALHVPAGLHSGAAGRQHRHAAVRHPQLWLEGEPDEQRRQGARTRRARGGTLGPQGHLSHSTCAVGVCVLVPGWRGRKSSGVCGVRGWLAHSSTTHACVHNDPPPLAHVVYT